MYIETAIEERLIEYGYDLFTVREKNTLVETLANRDGVPYLDITEEYVLKHHKQLKVDMLSERCEAEILNGFTASNGHVYRTNRDDQINLIGQQYELSVDESIDKVDWKTEDKGYISHTRKEWLKVYTEAFAHKKNQLYKYNTLKHHILGANTHAEICDLDWDNEEEKVEIQTSPVNPEPVIPVEKDPIKEPEAEVPVEKPAEIEVPEETPVIETPVETPEIEVPVIETPEVEKPAEIEVPVETPEVEKPEDEVPVENEAPAETPEVESTPTEEEVPEIPTEEEPVNTEGNIVTE